MPHADLEFDTLIEAWREFADIPVLEKHINHFLIPCICSLIKAQQQGLGQRESSGT